VVSESDLIHSTAIIASGAVVGPGCRVGPYAVIDAHVVLGADCQVGPGVHLTGHTVIGRGNRFHAGAVIGDAPQDFKYAGAPTRLRIGDDNHFREHVTIHRSSKLEEETRIGDRNLFMASSHVGHNCLIGSDNIVANGALLAGHVTLTDRAFISGNCLVHQNCRIGRLAMMQGGAAISKDLPPFCVARGDNGMAGLNSVGLRRAGMASEQRLQLRRLFHVLFRSGLRLSHAVAAARDTFPDPAAQELIEFVAASRRGVCTATGQRRTAGLEAEEEPG
jgi:UDP-N-acetylglucosamine acyltransferase